MNKYDQQLNRVLAFVELHGSPSDKLAAAEVREATHPQPAQQASAPDLIPTDDDVERVAKLVGWDNRIFMTPADYSEWCARMRRFVRLAATPQPVVVDCKNGQNKLAAAMHYPDCWDTAAYPDLASAVWEVCTGMRCSTCAENAEAAGVERSQQGQGSVPEHEAFTLLMRDITEHERADPEHERAVVVDYDWLYERIEKAFATALTKAPWPEAWKVTGGYYNDTLHFSLESAEAAAERSNEAAELDGGSHLRPARIVALTAMLWPNPPGEGAE